MPLVHFLLLAGAQGRAPALQPPGQTLSERRTRMRRALARLRAFDDEKGRPCPGVRLLFRKGDADRALVVAGGRIASFHLGPDGPLKQWSSRLVPKGAEGGAPPEGTLGRYLEWYGVRLAKEAWVPPEKGIAALGPWAYDREYPDYAAYWISGKSVELKEVNPNGAAVSKPTVAGDADGLPVLASEAGGVANSRAREHEAPQDRG